MTLVELQRKMLSAVLRPLTDDSRMSVATDDGRSMLDEAATFIKPNARLNPFERLEIYNRQYWFRVMAALAEDFPGLIAILGEAEFDAMAVSYLQSSPSRSYTLRNLGAHLEEWLCANPQWALAHYALAVDVVRLEWAYIEAFDGAQQPVLTQDDLVLLDEHSRLSLQPHLRLLELDHPVQDFIIAVHRAQRGSAIASNAVTQKDEHASNDQAGTAAYAEIPPGKTYLAVHRFENSVYYKALDPEAYKLLQAFQQNASIATALDVSFAGSTSPEADRANQIQQWFAIWSELGWFCRPPSAIEEMR